MPQRRRYHNLYKLFAEAGRKKGKTETKQTGKKKRTVTNSSDDEAKETPKSASSAGNGPVGATSKNKKQKVIHEKENRKTLKVIKSSYGTHSTRVNYVQTFWFILPEFPDNLFVRW